MTNTNDWNHNEKLHVYWWLLWIESRKICAFYLVEPCMQHCSTQVMKLIQAQFTYVAVTVYKHAAFHYGFNHWYSCDEVLKWNKVERQLNKMKQNVRIQNEYYALY
jgi:hypothetical protein